MTLEALEVLANLGAGPILRADELAADDALAVNDVGFRPHIGVEKLGCAFAGIADGGEVNVAMEDKTAVGVGVLIDADSEDGEVGLVVVEGEQGGHFLNAGRAPRGPEVEQDDLATIAGEMDRRSSIGDGEIGRGLVGLGRMRTAIAAGNKDQRQDGNECE